MRSREEPGACWFDLGFGWINSHFGNRRICSFTQATMADDYEAEEKKQSATAVMNQYSNFVMACIGLQVRPCDLRMHLMKEISGMPSSLKKETSQKTASPDAMGESSSSGNCHSAQ